MLSCDLDFNLTIYFRVHFMSLYIDHSSLFTLFKRCIVFLMCHNLFGYSSTGGHLGYFQHSGIANEGARDILVYNFVYICQNVFKIDSEKFIGSLHLSWDRITQPVMITFSFGSFLLTHKIRLYTF